jgi:tRNA-splicing ligase RtcB
MSYIHEVQLPAGKLKVYMNEEMFNTLDYKVLEMANNNLQIPNIQHMSYTPDVHVGVGTCIGTTAAWSMDNGVVSPSIVGSDIGCGMRVHLTNLHKEDVQDIRLRRKLVRRIEQFLPMEAHQRGHFSDIRLEHIVKKGLHGLPSKYVPDGYTPKKATSLSHVESSKYAFDEEVLNDVEDMTWHRAHRQLGTLGGGNHFAEIQAIEIAPEQREIAEKWGY